MRTVCATVTMVLGLGLVLDADIAPAQQTENLSSRPLTREIETALDELAHTEVVREEAMQRGFREGELSSLRSELREVIGSLRTCLDQQQRLLRETYLLRPSELGENAWTTAELESLGRHLQAQMARAYRNQALCYPGGSADRTRALSLALQQVAEVVDQPLDEPGVWQARLEQVASLRLLGRFDQAAERIRHWLEASPPPKVASLLFGEQLQLLLAQKSLPTALAAIAARNQQAGDAAKADVAETDDAILEVLLVARAAADDSKLQQLTQRAVAQLEHIRSLHSSYWQRRAETRLGRALAARPSSDDPKLLGFAAASLYAQGKLLEAASTYDRIAQLFAQRTEQEQQLEASRTAASILRIAGQEDQALLRLRELALSHRQEQQAAELHLIAIGIAADLVRAASQDEQAVTFQRYRSLLEEHLAHWPDAASSAAVGHWLQQTELPAIGRARAKTLVASGERDQAIQLYEGLLEAQPDDAELLEELAQLLGESEQTQELRRALALWRQLEQRSKPGGPRWKRGRQARLLLLERLGEGEKAKRLRQLTELMYSETWNNRE